MNWADKGYTVVALWCVHLAKLNYIFQNFLCVSGYDEAQQNVLWEIRGVKWGSGHSVSHTCRHSSVGLSHLSESVARSPAAPASTGSSFNFYSWTNEEFISMLNGLGFCRTTTQLRSEALGIDIGLDCSCGLHPMFMGSWLLLPYFIYIFFPSLPILQLPAPPSDTDPRDLTLWDCLGKTGSLCLILELRVHKTGSQGEKMVYNLLVVSPHWLNPHWNISFGFWKWILSS